MKIGGICGVIAALAVGVGCFAANVGLPILAIVGIAATLAVGFVTGGITYAIPKPNNKLEEANAQQKQDLLAQAA